MTAVKIKNKNVKGTKTCVRKGKLKLKDYRNCLEATQLENKITFVFIFAIWWFVLNFQ